MKYMILLGDGMADEPLSQLREKTPLEYARTPNMDRVAAQGTLGRIDTIPQGLKAGSDVANLSVLGYDPCEYYTGRAPLEAASMGIPLAPDDVAFRCNLVHLSSGNEPVMLDSTADHISTGEGKEIISDLNCSLGSADFSFHPGISYRHLLVWKGGREELTTTPPHDITGREVGAFLPQGPDANEILVLMEQARDLLPTHLVNGQRRARGLKEANAIWLWGQGKTLRIPKLWDRFQVRGGMISAVDLLNGTAVYAGMEVLPVEGATGYTDTNYLGKAEKALAALAELDLVFVHVEAPDEMGHEGNIHGKIKAIEDFDEHVVGTALRGLDSLGNFRIAILSDHPTPIRIRTHSSDPSPFAVLSSLVGENQGRGKSFSEQAAMQAGTLITPGHHFLEILLQGWRHFVEQHSR